MSTEKALGPFFLFPQRRNDWLLPQRTLKRKLGPSRSPAIQVELCYPSPPMSRPPSPPSEIPFSTSSESAPRVSASARTTASLFPSLPAPAPPNIPLPPPAYPGPVSYPATFSTQSAGPPGAARPSFGILQSGAYGTSAPPAIKTEHGVARPSSPRTGRKSKAHVASACANCKRAHLSCDVNRPCARCVASGKQVSPAQLAGEMCLGIDERGRTRASMYSIRSAAGQDYGKKASSRLSKCCKNRAREQHYLQQQLHRVPQGPLPTLDIVEQSLLDHCAPRRVTLRQDLLFRLRAFHRQEFCKPRSFTSTLRPRVQI